DPSYEWEGPGQTGTGPEFVFNVPDTPGQPFEVRCTVTADPCSSTGSERFTPLSGAAADRMIAACTFLDELGLDRLPSGLDRTSVARPAPDVVLPLVEPMANAARRFLASLQRS